MGCVGEAEAEAEAAVEKYSDGQWTIDVEINCYPVEESRAKLLLGVGWENALLTSSSASLFAYQATKTRDSTCSVAITIRGHLGITTAC